MSDGLKRVRRGVLTVGAFLLLLAGSGAIRGGLAPMTAVSAHTQLAGVCPGVPGPCPGIAKR